MTPRDIVFIGHLCYDELVPYGEPRRFVPGSAVLCGAQAAARVGCRVGVISRQSPADDALLEPLRAVGAECLLVPAAATTRMEVVHPSPNLDEREMRQLTSAGPFQAAEIPACATRWTHLAGITDQEFTLELLQQLRQRGGGLSTDFQSFVRQVDLQTRVIRFADVSAKRAITALLDRVKLDVVEAELLTGTADLAWAAEIIADWGCPEVVITRADGVLARAQGRNHFCQFTNRNSSGRTGRGDTTFAGYLAWRLEHDPVESVRFAAALVSIKMETPGPFTGTLADVLDRMQGITAR